MGILPIILFLLGVAFLLLGWRWQSSPSKEATISLKGLAYMKREMFLLQDNVHVLEQKIQRINQIQIKEDELRKVVRNVVKEDDLTNVGVKEVELEETDPKKTEHNVFEGKGKSRLYVLNTKDQKESGGGGEPQRPISPKYQEVLELAATGQHIQEIAQRLSLSQDAVRMVLRTQTKGETL